MAVLYYLLIKPISLLPLPVTYLLFSDFLYALLFHVIGFRKKVVWTNLTNSFPEKTEAERRQIMKQFYRHFVDLILESIRMFSMPKAEIIRRMILPNPEVLDQYYDAGRSVFIVAGHYNNWELAALVLNARVKHQAAGIYTPLQNPFFNKKLQESRGKLGLELIPKRETGAYFKRTQQHPTATIFGTDQSPTHSRHVHWTRFLNQDTAVMVGSEKYSRQYNYPVIFGFIKKVKRGHYEMRFEVLEDNPATTTDGEITERHTRWLEQEILEAPQYWLWSHKRWKRKRE